jgi:hypothetical protein
MPDSKSNKNVLVKKCLVHISFLRLPVAAGILTILGGSNVQASGCKQESGLLIRSIEESMLKNVKISEQNI